VEVFVARQAILDRKRRAHGYELLFRANLDNIELDPIGATRATEEVIANSVFAIGLDNLRGGKNAFVNFDRRMLLEEWNRVLPAQTTVVEILETVPPDPEVVAACGRLAKQGYRIALDDLALRSHYEPLLELASLIKIEIQQAPQSQQEHMVRTCHARGLEVVAERVDTYEQFESACNAGYDYFQGYFFARPTVLRGHQIQPVKLTYLRLLREAQEPELDFDRLTTLISEDVALSYKLTRYASSALFARRGQIRSVRHGLVSLGEENIRRWLPLVMLSRLAEDKPRELITCSLVRARFCESMAKIARPQVQHQAFLMGLFSLLDALLDRPLDEVLAEVHLASSISSALLRLAPNHDILSGFYTLVCRFEAADWQEVDRLLEQFDIPPALVRWAYSEALHWAGEALSGAESARGA
jgi:c-di-GMP-related signal transduction protein